jgi:RNase H-fold protein (predicted Holliday junction resolvase)
MAGTDLLINIVSQATGKGFLDSEKSVKKLQKNVKNLSKGLLAAFSVAAVSAFARSVSRTFSDAQKEAKLLENALNGVNLGFAAPFLGQFIDKLALATGKAGGDLTNAFVALSGATGDATTAQKLLNTALDISAGTGKDLQSVSVALGRAFKGETTALAKLRIGFSTAELQAMDFNELLQVLQNRFKGAGANAADSYAGKLARIGQAADLAKEKIGEGFVDGLEASNMSVEDFQENIVKLGTAIGTILGKAVGAFENLKTKLNELSKNPAIKLLLKGLDALVGLDPITGTAADMQDKTNKARKQAAEAYAKELNNRAVLLRISKAEALASKKKLDELKKMSKEKKDQLALDKAALALGKGEDVFDMDKIQIQAALLAKQDEINKLGVNATDQQKLQLANDLTRLSIKQTMAQLEDAIAAAQAATTEKEKELAIVEVQRLTKKLNMDLAVLGVMQKQEFKLKDIEKIYDKFMPKKLIDLDNLNQALELLGRMAGIKVNIGGGPGAGVTIGGTPGAGGGTGAGAGTVANRQGFSPKLLSTLLSANIDVDTLFTTPIGAEGDYLMQNAPVRIEIVDRTSGLIEVVQNAVIQNNRFGNPLVHTGSIAIQ